jgi:hypothetical protein
MGQANLRKNKLKKLFTKIDEGKKPFIKLTGKTGLINAELFFQMLNFNGIKVSISN